MITVNIFGEMLERLRLSKSIKGMLLHNDKKHQLLKCKKYEIIMVGLSIGPTWRCFLFGITYLYSYIFSNLI